MKTVAALLLVIGLVSASAAYAQSGTDEPDARNAAESVPPMPAAAYPAQIVPAPAVPDPAVPVASDQIEIRKIKSGNDYVTLNFTNVEINALIKVMSELTRRNFVLDERVTGKVTLMTPTKMTPDEAYQVFLAALEIKGFTAVEDGSVTRIIPTASARQSGLKVIQDGDSRGEGFVTKLIRLKLVNPQDIVRTISPLISKDGNLIAYPNTNSIIITDSVHNIRKIESLVRAMDVAAPEGKGKINVYYLKNANAEDISKLLSALVARLPVPPAGGAGQQASSSSILEGAVNISADKATNSLIIVASPSDFELVKDVIQKLDIRRRQVYVEAAIIEMGLSKQRELGFEMQVPINQSSFDAGQTTAVGGTNFGGIGAAVVGGPAALASTNGLVIGAVKGTFKFKEVTYLSIGALLRALQTDTDVNVLSTPNILTTDNQKAEIMVGQNVPFKTGQTQNATTGSGTYFNTIERKDVGIKLSLTPQITSDDNVRLEVNQEISDVIESTGVNSDGPTLSKRSASTTVVVKDRETMVIGGLIRDNVTSSTMKVPFLGDIPILGWLFKYKTSKVEKTNLMIFITPYIIKTAEESAELTRYKEKILDDFRKEYYIEKKGAKPGLLPKTTGSWEQPAAIAPAIENPFPDKKSESSSPGLGPARAAEKNGSAMQPAGASVQPQTEVQPMPEQKVESPAPSTPPPVNTDIPSEDVR